MDYDNWKCTPTEDYEYDPMEGYVPSQELDKFLNVEEFVKEIIHHMYETGDVDKIEDALDEITGVWGLQLPNKGPMIQKQVEKRMDVAREVYEMGVQLMKLQGELL